MAEGVLTVRAVGHAYCTPLPWAIFLLAAGLAGLAAVRRRFKE